MVGLLYILLMFAFSITADKYRKNYKGGVKTAFLPMIIFGVIAVLFGILFFQERGII